MKILILSDIHANLEALSAITESYDALWVLGDLVNYGPDPAPVVDFLRRHASLIVAGNHDYAVANGSDPRCSPAFRAMAEAMLDYTRRALNEEQLAFLRHLPRSLSGQQDALRFFLCHATPTDPLYSYLPAEPYRWETAAAAANADLLLVGHTHIPFCLEVAGKRIVNPGSVGQPKHGVPHACYAILENGSISLRSCPYPHERTIEKILALPIPHQLQEQLAAVLRDGAPPPPAPATGAP